MARLSKDFENELLLSAIGGNEAAREVLLSLDTSDPGVVSRDDVELLLSFAVDGVPVFMPGADPDARLRHATALCAALRTKPVREER